MTPENFIYWLQGFFEIGQTQVIKPEQVKVIKDHLALVLNKVTPDYPVIDTTQIRPGQNPQLQPFISPNTTGPVHFPPGTIICQTEDSVKDCLNVKVC